MRKNCHLRCSVKKGVLKNFAKFTGKETLARCFPVNFTNILKTPFLQNTSGRLLLQGMRIEFGKKRCAVLVMKKGKIVNTVGIELPDGKVIKPLQVDRSYKYFGILEADKFLAEDIELKISSRKDRSEIIKGAF